MLDLACAVPEPEVDVTWCFYACEEVSARRKRAGRAWRHPPRAPGRRRRHAWASPPTARSRPAARAPCGPWSTWAGRRAHTLGPSPAATPSIAWHRSWPRWPTGRAAPVVLDGCEYTEQLQAVAIEGGWPATSCPTGPGLTVNYRFAPDRDTAAARTFLEELLGRDRTPTSGDAVEVVDEADGARPRSSTRSWPDWWPAPARRAGPRWGGPTWRRSGPTGCRPPTSVRATRSWPTTPTSASPGTARAGPHPVLETVLMG